MNPTYTERQGQFLAYIYHYDLVNGCAPPAEADMQRGEENAPERAFDGAHPGDTEASISSQAGAGAGHFRGRSTGILAQVETSISKR